MHLVRSNAPAPAKSRVVELNQYYTPKWSTELIVETHFGFLTSSDVVGEPTCGDGAFLAAIDSSIPAFGVEVDPVAAANARRLTGRDVIEGDFRTVDIPYSPTAIIGNPPFKAAVMDGILERAHELLPEGGIAGFIIPAYFLQTPSRVCRYATQWSMDARLMPRTLFPRLSKPIVFCKFRKGAERAMVGLALFSECRDVEAMRKEYREVLHQVSGSAWKAAAVTALANCGGEADLDTIYRAIESKRPTGNKWWKEKIRQVLQSTTFQRVGAGRYRINEGLDSMKVAA